MAETKYSLDDGAQTTIETWGDRGPALLCIHGMTGSRRAWVRLAQRLSGKYRVIAYDQRGHGDSASVRGPMRLDTQVADLQRVFSAIGSDALALLGHSWGGAIAILGGRKAPVRGVMAIDPVLRVMPGTFRSDYVEDAEAMAALAPAAREQMVRESYLAWHPLDIEGKWHAVRAMTAEPIARLGSENRVDEGGWNILDAVSDYPKPLRIFAAGPDDSVMSREDVAHVRAAGGPNVRVSEYPSGGHNLHRSAFDAFATEAEAFLDSL
jgi:pimeloyl-ACP methyl ester carboxylesterase